MRRTAGVCVVAGMLILSGCGGGDDETSSTTTPTTAPKLTAKEVFDAARPSTVQLYGKQGESDTGGTGVIFDAAKGLVLTNAHVVAGVSAMKARINDQTETPARILATAPCQDVAVVQLTTIPPGLKAIPFGSSAAVQNQDEVVALGYPASFANPAQQKLVSTSGTVQSPNVVAEPDPSLPEYPSTIQHSATINPGNSGGPLLNDRAELIGINTLANTGTDRQEVQGQYYAISIDHIKPLLPELIAGRSQADPGWDVAPFAQVPLADVFEATGYGTREEGVRADQILAQNDIDGLFVFGANPDTPADDANIEGGDLIERINNVPVTKVKDVCDILQSASPGQTLEVRGRYLTNEGGDEDFGDPWVTKLTL